MKQFLTLAALLLTVSACNQSADKPAYHPTYVWQKSGECTQVSACDKPGSAVAATKADQCGQMAEWGIEGAPCNPNFPAPSKGTSEKVGCQDGTGGFTGLKFKVLACVAKEGTAQ